MMKINEFMSGLKDWDDLMNLMNLKNFMNLINLMKRTADYLNIDK